MIVNEQKPIILKDECNCIVSHYDLKEAMMWYSDKPLTQKKKIFMHGEYPAISIYGEKIHIHRLIMMYKLKRKLETNEYVHHRDGNKLNADSWNLELMEASKHQSLHTKGRKFSNEHKRKISEANRKRKGMKYKTKNY